MRHSVPLSWYYGCWWPRNERNQATNSYDFSLLVPKYSSFNTRRVKDILEWLYTRVAIRYIPLQSLQRRHNGHNGVSNHQPHDCLINRLFRRISKKTSKLRVTGLCEGNSPQTGELPAQRASNTKIVSIWWRHHAWVMLIHVRYSAAECCDPVSCVIKHAMK